MNDHCHRIGKCMVYGEHLHITVDEVDYIVNLREFSEELVDSGEDAKARFTVSPSGYGLCWNELDIDLSVDYLIGAKPLEPDWQIREVERRR